MKKTIYLALAVAALSTPPVMAEVTVPNTFVSGTPAVAAEVNDNFTTVANGVNDNAAGIVGNTVATVSNASSIVDNTADVATNTQAVNDVSLSVDTNTFNVGVNADGVATNVNDIAANTTAIEAIQPTTQKAWRVVDGDQVDRGTLLSINAGIYNDTGTIVDDPTVDSVSYITDEGYVRRVKLWDGDDSNKKILYFSNTNCDGGIYVQAAYKTVFENFNNLFYTDGDDVTSRAYWSSRSTGGSCVNYPQILTVTASTAFANEVNVTGVVDANNLTIPITTTYK